MGSGATESGDDMVVGRTNRSEVRTRLIAGNGEDAPDGYAEDFVLNVATADDRVLTKVARGVDAIHAKGTIEFATGGHMGVIPAGNGVLGRGLNGVVGYVHAAPRDRQEERGDQVGVLGLGGGASVGVLGRGKVGVVGCEQATPRDTAFEATEQAGVLGRGPTGVSGDGTNGPGVHGRGLPGIRGEGIGGPGVLASGQTGVYADGLAGPGIHGTSNVEQGGVFQARRTAQVWLVPLDASIPTPLQLPGKAEAGELLVTLGRDERGTQIASLWFCTEGGVATTASWTKLA